MNKTIDFTYTIGGAEFIIEAEFDKDGELYDTRAYTDADCINNYGELREVFVRKNASVEMVSVASLIDDMARDKFIDWEE